MPPAVKIEGGFAEVGSGRWLMGRCQPAAFFGTARRIRRRGWKVRDRSHLALVETTAPARCASAAQPFLTHIPCAAPVFAVSSKVLVAPEAARTGDSLVKAVPMGTHSAFAATQFSNEWTVLATEGRTARIPLEDGQTLSVRPDAVVAWTGKAPTGFCPRLSIWDVLLPRMPRDLLLTFYGPGVVWIEGTNHRTTTPPNHLTIPRRCNGV